MLLPILPPPDSAAWGGRTTCPLHTPPPGRSYTIGQISKKSVNLFSSTNNERSIFVGVALQKNVTDLLLS